MKRLERLFEAALWRSRFLVLLAVIGSLAAGLVVMVLATADVVLLVGHLVPYFDPALDPAARVALRDTAVTHVVEVVDGYLLGTVLLIFSFGLYELFLSDLDEARRSGTSSRILVIESLDDLKSRLGKVILMILIVTLFEQALRLSVGTTLDLLYLGGAVALVGVALWLGHGGAEKGYASRS